MAVRDVQAQKRWEVRFADLEAYKAEHGDCSVTAENPSLRNWVAAQRKCKEKLDRGEPSAGMTAERAARLTALDFVWEPRAH